MTLTPTVEERKGMTFDGRTFVMPEIPRMPDFTIPPIEIPRFQQLYRSPMLGIEGESLNQEDQFAEFLGVKDGVLVKSVMKNSAAEKAGIKAGDVIVKVDDTKVSTTREITSALRAARSKNTVIVTVVRNKREMPLTVTIEPVSGAIAIKAGVYIGRGYRPFVLDISSRPLRLNLATRPFMLKLSTDDSII